MVSLPPSPDTLTPMVICRASIRSLPPRPKTSTAEMSVTVAVMLPETISKEPIGPMVKTGDDAWFHVVRWVSSAVIAAEELGITSANVDQMRQSGNPEAKRLLGVGDNLGQKLGLSADWAYNAIKQVGNYGEIFERHVGEKTPLGLTRGPNELWSDGGLLQSPPFR